LHIEPDSVGLCLLEVPGSSNLLVHLLERGWKSVHKVNKKEKRDDVRLREM